ncbi:MAG: DEAD/DEAH box helicase, partial [Bacteroidales bacterium]|nr:DEAD/DEAH box helicase [Bacteroidales bacterium]
MSNFEKVINRYRNQSHSEADKGKRFERLMQAMLQTVPLYSNELSEVWLWGDFPYRESISLHDTGIDIVAKTIGNEYWAIQCKCYLANAKIDKGDVDTFLSTSARSFKDELGNKHYFSFRLWIDTTEGGFTSNAAESFTNQAIEATVLHLNELAEMPLDWEELDRGISGSKAITARKQLLPHQEMALEEAQKYYVDHDRGKLIMACGTGKTFTSLRIAERLAGKRGKVLFLVPSIALLGQTLREWSFDAQKPIRPLCICSDSEVSRTHSKDEDTNITTVEELAWPASTSVEQIKRQFLQLQHDQREGMLVVFSTYQSIERISAAQSAIGEELTFDVIICDEAHRTTGITLKGKEESAFVRVHDNNFIRGRKRIYMTATPRLYKEGDQKKARENEAYLCSMDDAELYGDEFYRLGFGEAVDKNLLSDYKVLILNVEPGDVSSEVQIALSGLDAATQKEVDTDDMAKLIGCINALSKRSLYDNKLLREIDPHPMHRAVAFCQNIRVSKAITTAFNACREAYFESLSSEEREGLVHVEARHVDGSMGAARREEHLGWLKHTKTDGLDCHLLSNVRCLSEGVDVPSLDAVIFLAAKNSQVDVVQSVGRVMRRAEGKRYGYIIIPIVVPSNVDPEKALDDNKTYAVVWDILNALRAHDDRFNAMVNKIDLKKKRPDTVQLIRPGSRLIGQGGAAQDGEYESEVAEPTSTWKRQMEIRFEQLQNVIFARMVQKVGSKRYWEQWAGDVARIAEKHIEQINHLIAEDGKARKAFDSFLRGLHKDINPSVSEAQAVEMLAQHIITQPVFEALFENYAFTENNPVSKAMNRVVKVLNEKID